MKTYFSIKDFAILHNLVCNRIEEMENGINNPLSQFFNSRQKLKSDKNYQELLNIREKLGNYIVRL